MRVLLDTQVMIEAYRPGGFATLPKKIQAILADPGNDRVISVASIVEIGVKSALGRLEITEAQTHQAVRDLCLTVIPLKSEHAFQFFSMRQRSDPFDRMIVATALTEGLPLLGGDREFKMYRGLQVIWR
ncbi:MAG TPA: type II toxin-antitoxin system VapC family toxin [Bryobacteraceae bacterium]|nr:type II toxin-antitoxin system VapC family toxin [Bryobacteraceae bacterium]